MARLRFDGLATGSTPPRSPLTLGAALDDDDTTITFPAALTYSGGAVPTIAGGDYLALSLLDSAGCLAEVVHLTAYTTGGTTATIVRGVEGSTARAHASGVAVRHGSTAEDFPARSVDDVSTWNRLYGSDLGYDLEFNEVMTAGSTLPSGWSWVNQGTTTYEQKFGAGILHAPADASDNVRGLFHSAPASSSWTLTGKFALASRVGAGFFGPHLRDSSSGKIVSWGWRTSVAGGGVVAVGRWNSATSWNGFTLGEIGTGNVSRYFRIRKVSSTSWYFDASPDGLIWTAFGPYDFSSFMTIDQIGWANCVASSQAGDAACHWLRVR